MSQDDLESEEMVSREDEPEDVVWQKHFASQLGVPLFVHTFSRIAVLDKDAQALITKLVFQDINNDEELLAVDANTYAIYSILRSISSGLLTGLQAMDSTKIGVLSMPGSKIEIIAGLNQICQKLNECSQLLERLFKEDSEIEAD